MTDELTGNSKKEQLIYMKDARTIILDKITVMNYVKKLNAGQEILTMNKLKYPHSTNITQLASTQQHIAVNLNTILEE